MRRVEQLITAARKQSGNERYDSDSGVSQSIFVQYLKNAQDSIVFEAINAKSKLLQKTVIVDCVYGQSTYTYPSDIFLHSIDTLEYSQDGICYSVLEKASAKDRFDTVGYPCSYIPQADGFILNSAAVSGKLRISYSHSPSRPQIRGGKILSLTQTGVNLSALALDVAEASYDEAEINSDNYLSIVDYLGNVKAESVLYTSVLAGVFTMPSFTLDAGVVISVGDYICVGQKVTNKPILADPCEGYLIKHCIYEAKYGDASNWSNEAKSVMNSALKQLIDSFGSMSEDFLPIPIIDSTYLMN